MIRRRLRLRRRIGLVFPWAFAALALVPVAAAGGVRIQSVDTSGFPAVRTTLVAPLGSTTPKLTENGNAVSGYTAVNLGREKALVVAVDRSQSMRGRPLAQALAAARTFVGDAGAADHVGVVVFGSTAFALGRISDAPGVAETNLGSVAVDGKSGTALYDAIVLAASRLAADDRPGRAIVVVTDGKDVSSSHTLDDAVKAARGAHAAVYAIGIGGPSFTPAALKTLASSTGGTYRQVANASGLASVYRSLETELARTWQLSYDTAVQPGTDLHLKATVRGAGSATTVAPLAGDGIAVAHPTNLIPAAGYSGVGTLAIGGAVGFLILLASLFWFASQRGSKLRARIEPHLGIVAGTGKANRQNDRAAARAKVADGVESVFGNLRQFKRFEVLIERADLPLRAGELVAAGTGCAVALGLVAAVAGSPAIVILVAFALGAAVPFAYISFRASRRIRAFDNQLPDLLITIAASLKAGHSFRQGIQSVVEEGADPGAKEFRRVLTETQLGKPMDDALIDLGRRIGSKNLTFVINAVTIQRQVGGSLAGLFDMVADTVRQRQQFERKVKGLTAMGRMSAYVLVGLPFFLAIVATMLNPEYMSPLYHTATGQKILATGAVMIIIGSGILKKIVSFRG
jgi:tight adherence protein B